MTEKSTEEPKKLLLSVHPSDAQELLSHNRGSMLPENSALKPKNG